MFYLLFRRYVNATFMPYSGNFRTNFYFFPGGPVIESEELD